jgi:GMP synthase (glutamine-hydrolysing)
VSDTNTVLAIVFHGHDDVGMTADLLAGAGYRLDIRCPSKGDVLEDGVNGYAGAMIFGGIMSANDDHIDSVRTVLDWLDDAIPSAMPLLGICLGAQLIARAAGARVERHREEMWEIGYYPVSPTAPGENLFASESPHFFEWHQDGFDLPSSAELLATGSTFPNQAYRIGHSTYGLQFHPEVTAEMLVGWMENSPHFADHPGAHSRDQTFAGASIHGDAIRSWLDGFLRTWVAGDRIAP